MSKEKHFKHGIRFAWHLPTERVVSPENMENGLACQCVCLACNGPVVARQGSERIWHFAHHRLTPCPFGAEAAIHWMAKQLIAERGGIFVPARVLTERVIGPKALWAETLSLEIQKAGFQQITGCAMEKIVGIPGAGSDYRRPDLVAQLNAQPLAIEIFNTHAVDFDKRCWLADQGYSVLEVKVTDLAFLSTHEFLAVLEDRLFSTDRYSKWLAHAGDKASFTRMPEMERELRESKKAEEAILLARYEAAEAQRKRREEFRERHRDTTDFKRRFDTCTVRIGLNAFRATVGIYGHAPDPLFSAVVQIARKLGGTFNQKMRWWEFYCQNGTKHIYERLCKEISAI